MEIKCEINKTKLHILWQDVNADYYKIFVKNDGIFCESAKVKNVCEVRLSLIPTGDNECFVQAFKNDILIDETPKIKFMMNTPDVVYYDDGKNLNFYYSKVQSAEGYRLYRKQENGFNGQKNSKNECITIEKTEEKEFKIKPFFMNMGKREFLTSSEVVEICENRFESISIYKSYNFNMFLSWNFQGEADGFMVYTQNSSTPFFETNDGLIHYLQLDEFKSSTKFIVKAFVNTINGRKIIAQSEKIGLNNRKFEKADVSLIIPAYNAENYIVRSIDSALASDFKNLEIVIINDGSTDNTQKIIDWYTKNYPNVVALTKENGGVADTRNVGIKAANGEYIAFMDNDDLIRPDMIRKLYNSALKNHSDVAIAPLYRLTDKGYSIHCNLPFEEDIPIKIDNYLEIMYTPGYYNCAIWNKLYRASIVKEHPLGILRYEDVSWTPCILSWADTICFLKTPFYEWDRKTRPETFGDYLAKKPEEELFEHRKQAMLFFIQNGNPQKIDYLKNIAKRRLARYTKMSNNDKYQNLIKEIDDGKY